MSERLRLLAQADLLLLLSGLLRPPGAATAPAATEREELAALLAQAGLAAPGRLAALLADLLARAEREPVALAELQTALFEGACRCPVGETAYLRRDKGAILADIAGFYRAFGFAAAAGTGEKSDHLVTELEFVALLLVLRAQAMAAEKPEAEAVTRDALAAFAADHLGDWLPAFCRQLREMAPSTHYRRLARLLARCGEQLCRDLGVAPAGAAALPSEAELESFRCGLACDPAS